jgi:hypothetical protein
MKSPGATQADERNTQDWIDELKAVASEHYSEGYGWQVFVECYTDDEWERLVSDFGTYSEAEAFVHRLARIMTERCEDACSEVF